MPSVVPHFGVQVFREQLRFEVFEEHQRFRSPRRIHGRFEQVHLTQAGAALDQEVEQGVDLEVVTGEFELRQRLQLCRGREEK